MVYVICYTTKTSWECKPTPKCRVVTCTLHLLRQIHLHALMKNRTVRSREQTRNKKISTRPTAHSDIQWNEDTKRSVIMEPVEIEHLSNCLPKRTLASLVDWCGVWTSMFDDVISFNYGGCGALRGGGLILFTLTLRFWYTLASFSCGNLNKKHNCTWFNQIPYISTFLSKMYRMKRIRSLAWRTAQREERSV